jgi:DMSO/TMAO reductase YedYZ molybdopterin-dependent catalytic subunit
MLGERMHYIGAIDLTDDKTALLQRISLDTPSGPALYYESIDPIDVRHPQTILAYGLNGQTLPIANGAPLRVRIEQQLGYKMATYIRAIEIVDSLAEIAGCALGVPFLADGTISVNVNDRQSSETPPVENTHPPSPILERGAGPSNATPPPPGSGAGPSNSAGAPAHWPRTGS